MIYNFCITNPIWRRTMSDSTTNVYNDFSRIWNVQLWRVFLFIWSDACVSSGCGRCGQIFTKIWSHRPHFFFLYNIFSLKSKLLPWRLCLSGNSLASTNRKHQQFYNVQAFTAGNKCKGGEFRCWSSLLFCLIWNGDACFALLPPALQVTQKVILPAGLFFLRLTTSVNLKDDWSEL